MFKMFGRKDVWIQWTAWVLMATAGANGEKGRGSGRGRGVGHAADSTSWRVEIATIVNTYYI